MNEEKQTTEAKDFPTLAMISAASGFMLCDIDDIYTVLNYATGESLFTHQLPRVGREYQAALLKARPDVAPALKLAETTTRGNYLAIAEQIVEMLGPTMPGIRMNDDQHERIDPLSELAEKVHPDNIIAVASDRAP